MYLYDCWKCIMQFFMQDSNIFGLSLTPLLASTIYIWIYDQRSSEFYCKLDFRMEIFIMNYAFLRNVDRNVRLIIIVYPFH